MTGFTGPHRQTRTEAVVEDCEFMAATGETLSGAATRTGYASRDVLERVLCRAGRGDLVAALKARESEELRELHMSQIRGRRRSRVA